MWPFARFFVFHPICNGSRTEWSPSRSVIIQMITNRTTAKSSYQLIKTITEFSNVIGHQQPDLSTNRGKDTVRVVLVIGQLKGQLTRQPCVSGQNSSCAPCCPEFRRVNYYCFLLYENA